MSTHTRGAARPPRERTSSLGRPVAPRGPATNRLTQDEAIRRFKSANFHEYDYSKVVYSGAQCRVVVVCSAHGRFERSAAGLVRGQGCHGCKKDDYLRELLATFHEIHGDRFDYSQVEWVSFRHAIKIICREHGPFMQRAGLHRLASSACPGCARSKATLTRDQWIQRFRAKYGNRFDYSQFDYVHSSLPTVILCPVHGALSMRPDQHLNSVTGCSHCGMFSTRTTPEAVRERLAEVHQPGRYEYERFQFTTQSARVIVTCTTHGDFEISTISHLNGNGCRLCSGYGTSFAETTWIDAIEDRLGFAAIRGARVPGVLRAEVDALFALPGQLRVAVEYDGQFWHGRKGALERDARKVASLAKAGFPSVRLRVDSGKLVKLPVIPGAQNIEIPEFPTRRLDVERVVSAIHTAGARTSTTRPKISGE